jgi:hypothetical protein
VKMMCAISTGVEKVVANAVEKYSSREVVLAGKMRIFLPRNCIFVLKDTLLPDQVNWKMVPLHATVNRARWSLGKIDETCEASEVILNPFLTLSKSLSLPTSACKDGFMVSATDFTGD